MREKAQKGTSTLCLVSYNGMIYQKLWERLICITQKHFIQSKTCGHYMQGYSLENRKTGRFCCSVMEEKQNNTFTKSCVRENSTLNVDGGKSMILLHVMPQRIFFHKKNGVAPRNTRDIENVSTRILQSDERKRCPTTGT